jgi:hypothetical protein
MSIPSTFRRNFRFYAVAATLAFAACGHPSTGSSGSGGSGGSSNCTPGTELCACLSDNTCNPGLACADDLNKCVTVGSSSTGSGGSTASGGATGSGGSVTGSGGTIGSGGATGSGGSNASGGSTGSGGSGPSGPNLVTNGDLSQGDKGWNAQQSPISSGVNNGQYCATIDSSHSVLIGWGGGTITANLMAATNYVISYQASASDPGNTTLEVHIGQANPPNNPDIDPITGDQLKSSPTTLAHPFSPKQSDDQAGVAFFFSTKGGNETVCLDNLVITQM